jgi:DNA-binding MarR family transcriptional regulator
MTADDRRDLRADQLAAYFTLMEVGSLLEQAVAKHLREDGDLSPVQAQILAVLDEASEDGLRMTDIADRIVYSRSGFSYQASKLERRGLVARAPAPSDERSSVLSLTPEGRDLLRRVRPRHIELVRALVFETMPAADIEALRSILEPVRDRLRQAPPRSARARGGHSPR